MGKKHTNESKGLYVIGKEWVKCSVTAIADDIILELLRKFEKWN